ncbi:MAG: alpha/beta fold hydrolase [Puniceicoccales bacterium]|jgi:haloalkane dehalogenase|nr:alpha/beta fold hydrolase [Puniceicoccales bacterium]
MDATLEYLKTCYPFAPHWLDTPGGRMHYVDTGGHGEPVLLLHGNPSWSFLWRDLIPVLTAEGFRCIAPDHLGMGFSDKPDTFFRLADRIEHIELLINKLKLQHFHLGVHDWGGAIGMGVAGRHPERVGKLLVTNSAAFCSARIPWRIALCRSRFPGEFIVRGLNAFVWPSIFMAAHRHMRPEVKAGFLAPYDSWKNRAAIARFIQDIPMEPEHPSRDTLQGVESNLIRLREKPMLIVWGGRDFCFNDTFLEEWLKRFPSAIVRHYAEAGHYVLEDLGTNVFPEIKAFFTGK